MIFNTVSSFSEGIYKEQKSEFISFIFPCTEKVEAEKILYEYKKKFNNAKHICWAVSLFENKFYDFSDDGEPGGTAGSCILNLIKSYCLFNVFIIIVRYFGGTKLGVKKLTNAYHKAALDALGKNKIVPEQHKILREIKILPERSYKLLNFLKKSEIKFSMQEEEKILRIKIEIPDDKKDLFEEQLQGLRSLK
ncbi:MAG: YigZ family protein [Cytophagales bacterium]|jgi:putative IMPACT (imprinted ancient) family translation regulator|nr:YigZ family protein [Cytophagales bacterium]